ncbi:hypothetical protein [Xanthomonas phage BUDD]|nr:hypothetical protein [Xanthomonas phage BUDD]
MTTENKITFAEFETAAQDLQARLSIIDQLFKEADALAQKVDIESFDDEDQDAAYELAHEIGYAAGWQFDSFGPHGGFWQPSTC